MDRQTLNKGGYTIRTTFDTKMQDAAAATVQSQITAHLDPAKRDADKYVQTAIATVVPGDGAVRVLYGGDDYAKNAFNASWQGTISPGSTFKAFVLAAYLQSGGTAPHTFHGNSPPLDPSGKDQNPNEGGRRYRNGHGRDATQQATNTLYLHMAVKA